MQEFDSEFINQYIENMSNELIKKQKEVILLKTQLDIALKKLQDFESKFSINKEDKQE